MAGCQSSWTGRHFDEDAASTVTVRPENSGNSCCVDLRGGSDDSPGLLAHRQPRLCPRADTHGSVLEEEPQGAPSLPEAAL